MRYSGNTKKQSTHGLWETAPDVVGVEVRRAQTCVFPDVSDVVSGLSYPTVKSLSQSDAMHGHARGGGEAKQ